MRRVYFKMVTKLIKNFKLQNNEYIITADHSTTKDYEIFYKGKKLNDVTAIVRRVIK